MHATVKPPSTSAPDHHVTTLVDSKLPPPGTSPDIGVVGDDLVLSQQESGVQFHPHSSAARGSPIKGERTNPFPLDARWGKAGACPERSRKDGGEKQLPNLG